MMAKLKEFFLKIREKFWEHEEVIKLRNRFSELDPKVQQTVIASSIGASAALLISVLVYTTFLSYSTKAEIQQINDDIAFIHSANEKMDILRKQSREQSSDVGLRDIDKNAPLPSFASAVAQKAAIAKESTEVKEAGDSVELKLNKISLKQLVRVLFAFENARNGISIAKVETDSRNDPEGYLWASVHLQKQAASPNSSDSTTKKLFTR